MNKKINKPECKTKGNDQVPDICGGWLPTSPPMTPPPKAEVRFGEDQGSDNGVQEGEGRATTWPFTAV